MGEDLRLDQYAAFCSSGFDSLVESKAIAPINPVARQTHQTFTLLPLYYLQRWHRRPYSKRLPFSPPDR